MSIQKSVGAGQLELVGISDSNGNQITSFGASNAAGSAVTAAQPLGYADSSGNTVYVSDTTPLPTIFNQPRGTLTDRSSTMTAGGTSQTLMAANTNRKYLIIVNPTVATENIYINFTSAATVATTQTTATSSIPIAPGGSYSPTGFVSTEAITINAATTGHAFIAKEG